MSATFAGLIRASTRRTVVLVEMTPSIVLGGFSASGGLANTYEIALPAFVFTGQPGFLGGVYRPCVGVRQDGTDLTERASAALVDANAGSWFWDRAADTLYLHTTTGADPDTFTVIQAFVRFYLSDSGIVLNQTDGDSSTGVYYHPRLIGGLPNLTEQVEDLMFGIKRTDTGELVFGNADGFWNTLIARNGPYAWKNKRVAIYLGGSYAAGDLPFSEYELLTTMLVEDVSADEAQCRFTLKPLLKRLDVEVPPTPYFESEYPNMGDGVRGTKKWIGYGRATIRPDLTDTTVSQGRWTIADAAYQTLFAVNNVWAVEKSTGARTLLTLTTHYTVDLVACTVTIVSATYPYTTHDIEVDVTGKPDGAGSYLQTFGEIVRDLLQTFLDVPDADLDLAAFAQADLDASQELSVWLKSPRQLTSVLATAEAEQPSLERSVMGTVQQTAAGQWTCWIWDPTYDPTAATTLRREDFADFKPNPKLETVFATTRVYYDRNHATGEWAAEEVTDTRVRHLYETTDQAELYTFLRDASAAATLAQRYQFMAGGVSLEIEFKERGTRLAQARAGDKILVDYAPAPDASGAFTAKPFEILRLDRGFSPTPAIAGRIGDLRGVGGLIGHWAPAGAADWAAAGADERAVNAYWADASGYIDPADGATKNIRIWW